MASPKSILVRVRDAVVAAAREGAYALEEMRDPAVVNAVGARAFDTVVSSNVLTVMSICIDPDSDLYATYGIPGQKGELAWILHTGGTTTTLDSLFHPAAPQRYNVQQRTTPEVRAVLTWTALILQVCGETCDGVEDAHWEELRAKWNAYRSDPACPSIYVDVERRPILTFEFYNCVSGKKL